MHTICRTLACIVTLCISFGDRYGIRAANHVLTSRASRCCEIILSRAANCTNGQGVEYIIEADPSVDNVCIAGAAFREVVSNCVWGGGGDAQVFG